MTEDLSAILRTIREVETSLERRSQRAGALVMITWGLVAMSIFTFYGLVEADRDPYVSRLGEAVRWVWLAPVALGYLITMLAQVRLGRMRADEGARSVKRLLTAILVPTTVVVLVITFGGWPVIPAMWVAFLGFTHLTWHKPPPRSDRIIAFASFALGALLALPPLWPWANFAAAAWYLVFLAGHGAYRYHRAQ